MVDGGHGGDRSDGVGGGGGLALISFGDGVDAVGLSVFVDHWRVVADAGEADWR